jgi:hypothetical protein
MAVPAGVKASWMHFVNVLGQVQTTLILSLIYGLILAPMALLLRLFGRADLLDLRAKPAASFARPKQMVPTDVERCTRQF